ncbi:MAG: S53 family peptidase [Actinomycetota bacterium]
MLRPSVCTRALVGLLVVVTAAFGVAWATGRSDAPTLVTDRVLGRTPGDAQVDLSLALELPGRARLQTFLRDVNRPGSASFGDYVSAEAFGRRFGLSVRSLDALERSLADAGLAVTKSYPQRTSLNVSGSARAVERFFDVELMDHVNERGDRYHAPVSDPKVPSSIDDSVLSVAGLDNEPPPPPVTADIASTDGLRPEDLEQLYNIEGLHDAGIDGEGVTVAIFTLYTYNESDVQAFDERYGIEGAPPVERVAVNGGTEETHAEDALDIQTVRAIAPMAEILNYEAPPEGAGFGEIVANIMDQIVAEGRTDIVSISYGVSHTLPYLHPEDWVRGEQALAAAAAQGINTFVASGDDGAFDCEAFDVTDHRICVSWPGDSEHVISVGGTLVAQREDGRLLREWGWQDELSRSGTGGGINPESARPDYQTGPGVDNEDSTGNRQLPDVAGPGDPDSGYAVVYEGKVSAVGGTSGSTPFWAGVTALITERARQEGIDDIGLLNPILYALGRSDTPPFFDVVHGGNRHHPATPGWDYATGWGSPNVAELTRDVVDYLQQNR